jgi:hypothetical protein
MNVSVKMNMLKLIEMEGNVRAVAISADSRR